MLAVWVSSFPAVSFPGFFVKHNTRAVTTRVQNVCACARSIFKMAVANDANFTTKTPFFELKSNFISIQNFKAGNVKPPGMYWSKDF